MEFIQITMQTITNWETGKISINGQNGKGIYGPSGLNSNIVNKGTISVDGEGSYGIYLESGNALNDITGVINVGPTAAGGIYLGANATGNNLGTINISSLNPGGESIAFVGSGTYVNSGTINISDSLILNSNYVFGTEASGNYGTLLGEKVGLEGPIQVNTNIIQPRFSPEYILKNTVKAETISVDDSFELQSSSLLYDAVPILNQYHAEQALMAIAEEAKTLADSFRSSNPAASLDIKLIRNDKIISDFVTGPLESTAEMLGQYHNEQAMMAISEEAREVVRAVDTSSGATIENSLKDIAPSVYNNVSREILDNGALFAENAKNNIESIGGNGYKIDFSIIGKRSKVDSRGGIEGYTSETSGFVGTVDLGKDTYASFGYTNKDTDYLETSVGNTQSLHGDITKKGNISTGKYSLSLNGEYNFHEMERDIESAGKKASAEFHSARIGLNGEVAKDYNLIETVKLTPTVGGEVAYVSHETIKEKNADGFNAEIKGEKYLSIKPKVGAKVEKEIYNVKLYTAFDYSYELGNMDTNQKYSLKNLGTAELKGDNLKGGKATIKLGAEYKSGPFGVNGQVGQEFGKRDNKFIGVGVKYNF